MQLVQARVAEVGEHDGVGMDMGSAFLEEPEVVRPAPTKSGRNHIAGLPVEEHLSFQGVPFFLPTVTAPLLFSGRSTGVSVASITTNDSSTPSPERTARLPGNLNAPDAAKAPSTLRMMRLAFAS